MFLCLWLVLPFLIHSGQPYYSPEAPWLMSLLSLTFWYGITCLIQIYWTCNLNLTQDEHGCCGLVPAGVCHTAIDNCCNSFILPLINRQLTGYPAVLHILLHKMPLQTTDL